VKHIVLVLAHEDYRDEEYERTLSELIASGVVVKVASTDLTEAKGVKGGTTPIDLLLSDINPDDYDGIAFIGGPGSKEYVGDVAVSDLARKFASSGKPIGAICYAPAILAKAGLLKGKRATGWKTEDNNEVPELIVKKGGIYSGESVVTDGNIITAFNHLSAEEFGKTIAQML